MSTAEGADNTSARASSPLNNRHPSISPSSIPPKNSPPSALPQYFQPLQNNQQSKIVMPAGNQQQNQTHIAAPQHSLPNALGLEAKSYESQVQAPLNVDGASSVSTSIASSVSKEAVILGVQALERQQEELERKQQEEIERRIVFIKDRRHTTLQRDNPFDASPQRMKRCPQDYKGDVPSTVHLPTNEDSSKNTSLSSINRDGNTCEGEQKKSLGKLLRSTLKKKKNTNSKLRNKEGNESSDGNISNSVNADENDVVYNNKSTPYTKPIISGYLYKRGRQGKWQRRWFESDGNSLRYFKSEKRKKLLATLDLRYVGSVAMDDTDPAGFTFTIEVAGRNYYLCADSREYAMDWVISMNRVKEAKMGIGNLKLIEPIQDENNNLDDDYTPRVVLETQRKRSKGFGNDDFNNGVGDLMDNTDGENSNSISGAGLTGALSPVSGAESILSSKISSKHAELVSGRQQGKMRRTVLGRWNKRRPSYQNWIRRLSRWARRLTLVRCVVKDDFEHLETSNKGAQIKEEVQESPSVDTCTSNPLVNHQRSKNERTLSSNSGFEVDVDPTKHSHYTLEAEGRTLNQISEGDTAANETKKSLDDEVYSGFEQKTKVHSSWAIGSQKRAMRKKIEDQSSRESSANEDVDSSSGRESPITIDDEASGVV